MFVSSSSSFSLLLVAEVESKPPQRSPPAPQLVLMLCTESITRSATHSWHKYTGVAAVQHVTLGAALQHPSKQLYEKKLLCVAQHVPCGEPGNHHVIVSQLSSAVWCCVNVSWHFKGVRCLPHQGQAVIILDSTLEEERTTFLWNIKSINPVTQHHIPHLNPQQYHL